MMSSVRLTKAARRSCSQNGGIRLEYFAERLRGFVHHLIVLQGGMTGKKRRELVAKLAEIPVAEERLVLATGRYVGEGFDDERLDKLFLAMPISWKGTLVQYAGRLYRKKNPADARGKAGTWLPAKKRLQELVEEATIDAYGESEQRTGFLTMLEEELALPFETQMLGVPVMVERIDLTETDEIVAICRRGAHRQAISILELPLPAPPPGGAEWIEAYRCWARGV